jgi:drug/metabolite transporter (DMT)-like permease
VIETLPFIAVLASALLHATWNAIARSGPEPGDVLASGVMASGLISIPCLLWFGLPSPESLPWLFGGVIINTIGIRLAMAAYRSASFGLAYPVMRAGIPLLTLPIGVVILGEWPRPAGVVGVLLIASALIMLAFAARRSARAEMRGLGYALLAAFAGAGYVTADAGGVRLSGNIFGYAFLVALGNAMALGAMYVVERRNPLVMFARYARLGFTISAFSTSSFLLYVWVVSQTPVALAAALREISVLFAVGIAQYVLKEEVSRYQWLAAALAVAGVIAIRMA